MGNGQPLSDRCSRRTFSKSIGAALLTAPFALAAEASGQVPARGARLSGVCPQLGDPQEPHEPPIIVGGGSLTMECEKKMIREGSVNNAPRKHLYEFEDYRYGRQLRLEVITEYQKTFTYECFPLGDIAKPRLKVWLQRLQHGVWTADDIDPSKTDAHIFFTYEPLERFSSVFDATVVETDKKFGGPKQGFKLEPTFKHKHKGYGSSTHYRIGRWVLLDDAGSPVHGDAVGPKQVPMTDDRSRSVTVQVLGFQLIPRFDHLEERLRNFAEGRR